MDTPHETANTPVIDAAQDRIVYVRPVDIDDLPDEVREQVTGSENIFAVHATNGDRLALVSGRDRAFVLARQNDMRPVHVH
ncbi:DUF1150 family protein [Meridianimarinicoccus aquatilis]|uniref:DUF1150 family protein n=1 Tax=Meridianimarinicoccus aquatilis TaxID=2552766 RepID=A0A4V3BC42_9RHOB|nr:DUF1150 family protein [Fluviibacterium aquatile]QIE41078.1 DUF1150 family protein [Rhodobacteraceae bacterium SC52]TDL89379.1 DUF1150 family protein [Fluviibacterium aquatile]